jgi:hypothetical protein
MLGLALLLFIPAWGDERPPDLKKQAEVGMDETQLIRALGRPKKIARQILFRRHIEQWSYDSPRVQVELECLRGQSARVTSVQSLEARKE